MFQLHRRNERRRGRSLNYPCQPLIEGYMCASRHDEAPIYVEIIAGWHICGEDSQENAKRSIGRTLNNTPDIVATALSVRCRSRRKDLADAFQRRPNCPIK